MSTEISSINSSIKISGPYKILILADDSVDREAIQQTLFNLDKSNSQSVSDGVYSNKFTSLELVATYDLWSFDTSKNLVSQEDQFYGDADGAVAIFDLNNPSSFENIATQIKNMIRYRGKILPLILIGNNQSSEFSNYVRKEDVLEYAYSLGDVATCKIPYLEFKNGISEKNLYALKHLKHIISCPK